MMNTMTLHLNRKEFRPKDTIEGRVSWQLDKTPKDLQVRLFWHTRGRGTEDLKIVEQYAIPPGLQGEQGFSFTLSPGPYSFSGKLISLIWAVEFVTNPSDDCAREDIILSPSGQEIAL